MKKSLFDKIQEDAKRFGKKMEIGKKEPNKEMSMRDMLGKMRKLNEEAMPQQQPVQQPQGQPQQQAQQQPIQPSERPVSAQEERGYQEKMLNYFQEDNVHIEFSKLLVYDQGVFWGGTVDNQLQFTYTVTPDETTSGVQVNYLQGFDKNDQENQKIVDKIEAYYDEFYQYWRDNELEIDN
jgi:hypothetical protein